LDSQLPKYICGPKGKEYNALSVLAAAPNWPKKKQETNEAVEIKKGPKKREL